MTVELLIEMMNEKIKALREGRKETNDEHIEIALEHAARTMERVLEKYEEKK